MFNPDGNNPEQVAAPSTRSDGDITTVEEMLYMDKLLDGLDRTIDGLIKSATVSKAPSGKYFVSLLVG